MNNKQKYAELIKKEFPQKKVLVIGDIMVDEYITGSVRRISPEAPVPILDFKGRKLEAGGASNVAHNMKSLGADVTVVGTAAEDEAGMWLRKHFCEMGIDTICIIPENDRPTTIKTRYATKGQQLLRVDNEDSHGISENIKKTILSYIESQISKLDVVVMSDYCKGVFQDEEFVKKIISICNNNKVLVSIDSKSRNISAFENADFVKPNNLELEEAVQIHIEDDATLNLAGEKYLKKSRAKALIVTRGNKGISVFEPNKERMDYPAKDVQVFDVCGAGDTVISTISIAMTTGLTIGESVKIANLAAGVVISKVGTVAVTVPELLRSLNEE